MLAETFVQVSSRFYKYLQVPVAGSKKSQHVIDAL